MSSDTLRTCLTNMVRFLHEPFAPTQTHPPMNLAAPSPEILATAVLLVDQARVVQYLNPAAENLLGISGRHALRRPLAQVVGECTDLVRILDSVIHNGTSYTEHDLCLQVEDHAVTLSATVTPVESAPEYTVIELRPVSSGVKIAREEITLAQVQAGQSLVRQLAHEIRNPLGGIRGAAQLLEAELNGAELSEYTQVIIKEADRLQGLLDRLLTPAKRPEIREINIHEVLERVRSLLLAEFPRLAIERDYDTSVPDIAGDPEQIIQAVLNIARNAAQAMQGRGQIRLKTRIARQVTLAGKRRKLAVRIDVIDNGPGIPEELQDTIFFPMVSGREGGTGVGLTLAQSLVQRHEGAIHMVSEPGFTCFSIYLPIQGAGNPAPDDSPVRAPRAARPNAHS